MKEFEAKVRLNEENGGKTGELDIMSPPPFDKGYFNGVTFGITFKDPVFEAEKEEKICPVYSDSEVKQPCVNCLECEMTREEAIEVLYSDRTTYRELEEAIRIAVKALKEQIPQWIPCSERLPNTNGIYIVTRIIEEHLIKDVSYFDGSNTWHADNRINHNRDYLKDVVAWMPLPEPYKKGGDPE